MQTLPLPCGGREAESERFLAQVTHNKAMLKITYKCKTYMTNNNEIIT